MIDRVEHLWHRFGTQGRCLVMGRLPSHGVITVAGEFLQSSVEWSCRPLISLCDVRSEVGSAGWSLRGSVSAKLAHSVEGPNSGLNSPVADPAQRPLRPRTFPHPASSSGFVPFRGIPFARSRSPAVYLHGLPSESPACRPVRSGCTAHAGRASRRQRRDIDASHGVNALGQKLLRS